MTAAGVGERNLIVSEPFSLARTCGPVAWGGGRWPNIDWRVGELVWAGWEGGRVVWRRVGQVAPGRLAIAGSADVGGDASWAGAVLGIGRTCESFADPVIERLRGDYAGLRPFADGSLFDGLVTSIVGQSISVASAAVTLRRLAAQFSDGIEIGDRLYWPLPRADHLAEADPAVVRQSGVTGRRAAALVAIGRAANRGELPADDLACTEPDRVRTALRRLPLVGPWTAESALLWGIGLDDAHPTGDVALLRAARLAYGEPGLDLPGLDRLAERWRPARAWAARLLWVDLLGPALG